MSTTKRRRSGASPALWIGWAFMILAGFAYGLGLGLADGWLWALAVTAVGVPVSTPLMRSTWRLLRLIRRVDAAQVAVVHRTRPVAEGARR